ncbi:hypothetical protein FF2_040519 [Malus domestica]
MAKFMLFQDFSGFVHQHLVSSVGNDTKSCVDSLSFFHLRRESVETWDQNLRSFRITVEINPVHQVPILTYFCEVHEKRRCGSKSLRAQ